MKISIIIPVFNLEDYISDTLDSVFSQTYPDFEVIAVDDGSTDRSPVILDAFAEKEQRLRVIHKANEGVTLARLEGVRAACGDYIGFVDGDDRIDADMYEKLMRNAIKENADISHCGYRVLSRDGECFYYNSGEYVVLNKKQSLMALLDGSKVEPSLCTKLFKKNLFSTALKNEKLDLTIRNNEDLLLNYFLFKYAVKTVYEDVCPYQYFVRDASASKGKMNVHKLADPIKVGRTIYDDLRSDDDLHTVAERLYVLKLMRAATFFSDEKDLSAIQKKAKKELRRFLPRYLANHSETIYCRARALLAGTIPILYAWINNRIK